MKLFLLTQRERTGYDTFDSCVVVAEDAEAAKKITPTYDGKFSDSRWSEWASGPDKVTAEYLGEARPGHPGGVVCSSFNAG